MINASDLKKEIEARLTAYLSRDKSGIRAMLLKLLVKLKSFTVNTIHKILSKKFSVSFHSVASMIGNLASKFCLLSVKRTKDGDLGVYELKPQYYELVIRITDASPF
ncbi:MAG TPA: DUF2551 domain-containing protein [Methanocorpusculum sp.]|nr:DUF2551 domain-containing protein [Methanocorpusculum sp.]